MIVTLIFVGLHFSENSLEKYREIEISPAGLELRYLELDPHSETAPLFAALGPSLQSPVERGASLESGPRPCGHDTSSGVIGPTGTHLTKMNSVWP
jgi:hypothetical protein